MKKLSKTKKTMVAVALLATGGVTGYAASSVFSNLDNIQTNFDTVFNIASSNKSKSEQLQRDLEAEKQKLRDQENVVGDLRNQLLDKDNLINSRDQEITSIKNTLAIAETNLAEQRGIVSSLQSQLTDAQNQLAQVEQRVQELSNYTDSKVNELGE